LTVAQLLAHAPALVVVVPLMAAAICVLIRDAQISRGWAVGTAWLTLALSIHCLLSAVKHGPWIYYMGGIAPPWGIAYKVDVFSGIVMVLVSAIASVTLPFGPTDAAVDLPDERKNLFYTAFLLCMTGLLGMTITADLFNVFVFLEISSLATYVLIAMGKDRRAFSAAFTYLVIGTIGGTFYLIGVGFIYVMTGSLNMADISTLLLENVHGGNKIAHDTGTVKAGLGFIITGLSIKLAVFPLHQWLPNAYTYSPPKVTAFLAATATKVSLYAMIRVLYGVFGAAYIFGELHLERILLPLALLGIFGGTIVAIYENNIKRMLAYSSIAQVGYMLLGISLVSVVVDANGVPLGISGLTGGIVHLLNHAMMKGGLFLVLACVVYRVGSVELEDFRGLGQKMPLTMAAFVVGGLSMMGVPLTVGFISKWYLVLGTIERGWWPVTILLLVSSLLSVLYIWKVVEAAYFYKRPEGAPEVTEAPLSMLIPTWVLIGASVVFGVYTPWTAGVAEMAAKSLMGVS